MTYPYPDQDWPTRGARAWSIVALLVAVFLIALVASAGCVRMPYVPPATRTDIQEGRAAVLIQAECTTTSPFGDGESFAPSWGISMRYGTAVAVDERHLVTAYHVAHCPFGQTISGLTWDHRRLMLQVVEEDREADLALLEIATQNNLDLGVPPPVLAAARVGDVACSAVAYPRPGWNCGAVEDVDAGQPNGGILGFWESAPGNSGAGLYVDGRLVGIVVHLRWCDSTHRQTCGGDASALLGRHPSWFAQTVHP